MILYTNTRTSQVLQLLFITCAAFASVSCDVPAVNTSAKIVVSLNQPIKWLNRELYSQTININGSSTIQFNFINVNKNISFIIFQVHSHLYNVTLYNDTFVSGSYVSGTNIGLYSSVVPKINTFYLDNANKFHVKVLISVHGYGDKDPIPGGCNMEFPVPISPFIITANQKDYINIDAAPARYYADPECIRTDTVNVQFYMLYLPAQNFDSDVYFNGIKNMMTMEGIIENGQKIPKTTPWLMRRILAAYTGTGTVYAAIASSTKHSEYYSVYVPAHSYACVPTDDDGCEILDDTLSKLICACLLFTGIFTCYFGHRFFKSEMFMFGMLSGFLITYILISLMSHLSQPALVSASLLSGLFFGAIWLTFWWFYGIPVIAVSIPALNVGFLIAAIMYNMTPSDVLIMQQNFNFWTLFILLMIIVAMILIFVAFVSNILCCAILGAYAVVYPIDMYIGSHLKYIIINTVRRATVPKFNKAVVLMPYDEKDSLVVVLWIILAVTGFVFQHYHNRGRPPFPPPPRSVRPGAPQPSRYGTVFVRPREMPPSAPVDDEQNNKNIRENTPLLA